MQRPRNPLLAFLFIVALLLPWLMFLFRPGGINTGHVLFLFTLFFCLLLLWMMSATRRRLAVAVGADLGPRMLNEAEQPEIVRQVMDVKIAISENASAIVSGSPPRFRFGELRKTEPSARQKLCAFGSGR